MATSKVLRIAFLAPLVAPIAPPYLGGAQALLADLAAGLAARGHDVTLYALPGSAVLGARIVPVTGSVAPANLGVQVAPKVDAYDEARDDSDERDEDEPDPFALDPALYAADTAYMDVYRAIARESARYDLVHAHAYDWGAYAHSLIQPLPVVHTLHMPAGDPALDRLLGSLAPPPGSRHPRTRPVYLTTVSQGCAATYAAVCRIDAVIHNGIAVERVPFVPRVASDAPLLFAGRMSPEKGVIDALEIAARSGRPLLVVGDVYDKAYFAAEVEPRLAAMPNATYLGPRSREDVWRLMGDASALLCPSRWQEPFGLAPCEAQAAGTPVIAYARGGLGEVVADGRTGYVVAPGDVTAAADAVGRVGALDRAACRAWVSERFDLPHMLDGYEALYSRVLSEA